jgi:hypothetical protein
MRTQPFPVNGDRGQQMIQPPSICQGAQPAAGDLIEPARIQGLQQGADALLAGRDDPPPQRVRPAAETGH